jgi:hypothetical protein
MRESPRQQAEQAIAGRIPTNIATLGHLMKIVLRVIEQIAIGAPHAPVRIFNNIVEA